MKKIIVIFMTLLATNSLYSQSKTFQIFPNFNNNTVKIRITALEDGQFKMGVPKSSNGCWYTYDKGVQTSRDLGDNATKVLFQFTVIDGKPTIMSGTEAVNEIVKAQSSKTTFNDSETTSIEIHVGDVFTVMNATLMYYSYFQVISYDGVSEDLTLVPIMLKISYSDDNCVIPETIYLNNEKYTVTEIAEEGFKGCSNLTSVTIPSTITKVGENAFSGCTKLKDVTCLATTPPEAYANSFENYNGYLHVPCESKDDYDFANCWGSFKHVECIGTETVE